MELSVIDKIVEIFKYIFSSFMTIELLLITLLLFVLLMMNAKRNNKIVKIVTSVLVIVLLISVVVAYRDYAISSINTFIKWIMNYIYFPSLAMYFLIIVFITGMLVYTILNKKMTLFLRRVNYSVFGVLYLFFANIISLAVSNKINLTNVKAIYSNNTMLSFIQISGLIFFFWIEFILIYKLFQYFKKKYD